MKFLSVSIALSALACLASAAPLEERAIPAGDINTSFPDKFCGWGYSSCGKAGTNGGPGNRCAMVCENIMGGAALGFCKCPTGWYPNGCITLGKYLGRHKCY